MEIIVLRAVGEAIPRLKSNKVAQEGVFGLEKSREIAAPVAHKDGVF
jgi:hypothetical protein